MSLGNRWRPLVRTLNRNSMNGADGLCGDAHPPGAAARTGRVWLAGALALLLLVASALSLRADAAESAVTRFDATSVDSFARSYEAIVAALPAREVPRLELAVERTLRYYALTTGRNLGQTDLINLFGGKTADQVVAAAPLPDDPALL